MKLHFVLSSICLSFILFGRGAVAIQSNGRNDSNKFLSSMQIIRKYGYPAEAYTVETADGYLLEMHRIPHGLNPTRSKGVPVYIQHGLLGSSADFLVLGANESLGFLLADLGYDVWLGNVRGNAYSTAHVSLNPNDRRFWNFSWHESAIYDLPAQIDFIRNVTEQEKVVYIGHSMGTTMFLVMASVLPQYNERVELALLMAVVGYVKNIRSPLLRLVQPFLPQLKVIFDVLSDGAVFPERGIWTALFRWICSYFNLAEGFCTGGLFLLLGVDPAELNEARYNILLYHYPSGYSFKAINHYAQLVDSGEFRQYDYGLIRNELKYGSPTPPDYEVEKIKVPMYFYEGQNDYLSTLPDVKRLSKRLSTLQDIRVIEYPKFNHLDFLAAVHVKKYLYDKIINDLEWYMDQ